MKFLGYKIYLLLLLLLVVLVPLAATLQRFVAGKKKLSWSQAQKYCDEQGMSLPEILSQDLNDMLAMKARQYVVIRLDTSWNRIWLAGNRIGTTDFYQGDTQSPVSFVNFDADNEAFMDGQCIEMYLRKKNTFAKNWATANCSQKKRFFCMIL